uniref:Small ribosomal subunit protein mS41 SAM domain-containing protein n=1 Tax=Oryza barthii TaxID=65489 RepID=A0A0D3HB73_9ORYZ
MALACASHLRRLGAGAPARSFHPHPYQAKVGVVEFLNGVGKGVETHAAKVEEAVGGDLQSLLHARTLRLKKLGIPCKQRKLILSFAHKYRLGLWKP